MTHSADLTILSPNPPGEPILEERILDAHGDPAAVIDAKGGILRANRLFSAERGLADPSGAFVSAALQDALAIKNPQQPRLTITLESAQVYELTILPFGPNDERLILAVDRTMDVSLRNALTESRARFRDLVQISSDLSWEADAEGRFGMITPRGLAGYDAKFLLGQTVEALLDPAAPPPGILPFASPTPVDNVELWLRHADGRSLCYEVSAVPLYDKSGEWVGSRGVCRDVTQDRHYRTQMAAQRNRDRVFTRITSVFRREADPNDMLQSAASACTHGFVANGCQIFSAPSHLSSSETRPQLSLSAAFGQAGESALSDSALARLLPNETQTSRVMQLEHWSVLAAPAIYGGRMVGAILLWRTTERPAWNDSDLQLLASLIGQLAPAIEQRAQHHLLLDASRNDALTGLLNRRGFYDEMKRRFNRLMRDDRPAALVYVDLDNFKLVNDSHGHARGDEALRHVADILRHNTRSTDLVARLGGDEFAIWLDNADEQVAVSRAQIFLLAGGPLAVYSGDSAKPLKLSIGIAVHHAKDREDINQLMSRADAAMYAVKRAGKGNYAMAAPPSSS